MLSVVTWPGTTPMGTWAAPLASMESGGNLGLYAVESDGERTTSELLGVNSYLRILIY
jgi:hypothetical protein